MATRLAKAYVFACAVVASLVLTLMIILHLSAWRGFTLSGTHICGLGFLTCLPLLGLAKEKNIWTNEVRALPRWVSTVVLGIFIYYFAVFGTILLFSDIRSPLGASVLMSGFFIMLLAGPLCVPIALLKSDYVTVETLNKRALRSLVFVLIGMLITTLAHFHLIPNHHNYVSVLRTISQDLYV